jgi:hypothetical protein
MDLVAAAAIRILPRFQGPQIRQHHLAEGVAAGLQLCLPAAPIQPTVAIREETKPLVFAYP